MLAGIVITATYTVIVAAKSAKITITKITVTIVTNINKRTFFIQSKSFTFSTIALIIYETNFYKLKL